MVCNDLLGFSEHHVIIMPSLNQGGSLLSESFPLSPVLGNRHSPKSCQEASSILEVAWV